MTTDTDRDHLVTRAQLRGYGLSGYLVRRVTAAIEPVAKQGNAHCFELGDIMAALRDYADRPHVQSATRAAIQVALTELSPRLGNVITAQFGIANDDRELRESLANLLKAQQATDQALAEMKAIAAEIRGRSSR